MGDGEVVGGGPAEGEDLVRTEVGDFFRFAAGDRLALYVGEAVDHGDVGDGTAVGRQSDMGGKRHVDSEDLSRGTSRLGTGAADSDSDDRSIKAISSFSLDHRGGGRLGGFGTAGRV